MINTYATEKEMQKEYDEQMKHHCPDCGSLMILKQVISYFSPITGEPNYQFEGRCPNERWWKWTHAPRIYPMPVVRKMKSGKFGTAIPKGGGKK